MDFVVNKPRGLICHLRKKWKETNKETGGEKVNIVNEIMGEIESSYKEMSIFTNLYFPF